MALPMRRFGALLLLTITLLAGCGGRESPVSPDEAPETALTEQDGYQYRIPPRRRYTTGLI